MTGPEYDYEPRPPMLWPEDPNGPQPDNDEEVQPLHQWCPSTAEDIARHVLTDFDAGGTEEHPVSAAEAAYWLGRVAEALRLILGTVTP